MDFLTLLNAAPLLMGLAKAALPQAVATTMAFGQWVASVPPCRDFAFEATSYRYLKRQASDNTGHWVSILGGDEQLVSSVK